MELGSKVTVPRRILRRAVHMGGRNNRKEWYAPDWMKKSVNGIYIGFRTYANGTVTWDEEGNYFKADEWIKVALIVEDAREKPIPVMYSDMSVSDAPKSSES